MIFILILILLILVVFKIKNNNKLDITYNLKIDEMLNALDLDKDDIYENVRKELDQTFLNITISIIFIIILYKIFNKKDLFFL